MPCRIATDTLLPIGYRLYFGSKPAKCTYFEGASSNVLLRRPFSLAREIVPHHAATHTGSRVLSVQHRSSTNSSLVMTFNFSIGLSLHRGISNTQGWQWPTAFTFILPRSSSTTQKDSPTRKRGARASYKIEIRVKSRSEQSRRPEISSRHRR